MHEYGYFKAELTKHLVTVDKKNFTASISIIIHSNQRFHFGEVEFINTSYQSDYLNKFINFNKNTPFHYQEILDFQDRLLSSDVFDSVQIDPLPQLDDSCMVPIKVYIKDKPHNTYTGNIGYGTDTGPRGGVGWRHLSRKNEGHRSEAMFNSSKVRREVNLSYLLPGDKVYSDKIVFGSSLLNENINDIHSNKYDLTGSLLKNRNNFQQIWSIRYFNESFKIMTTTPKQHKIYLLPSIKLIWSDIDKNKYFSYGLKTQLYIKAGLGMLLSSADFAQLEYNLKWIYLFNQDTRLIFRTNLGITAADKFDNLSPSLRFFVGGDQSIRGYSYNSLSSFSADANGKLVAIGGKYLAVTSFEIERQLKNKLSTAIFIDTGNAFNSFHEKFAVSIGSGLRFATPIGAFRVDLAKPLNIVAKRNIRIHLNFSSDFS